MLRFTVFLMTLAQAGDETAPVVGRPGDFSHVVGAFTISAEASPLAVQVEEAIELRVAIAGQAAPGQSPRLARLKLFPADMEEQFFVEPVSEHAEAGRWRFVYRLRPKSTAVKHVPGLKLVYYTPRQRRYQTAYSDAIPIEVKPRADGSVKIDGLKVISAPPSFFELAEPNAAADGGEFELTLLAAVLLFLAPPLACAAGLWAWRRRHPAAEELRRRHKHRAAQTALDALGRNHAAPPALAAVLTDYLRGRLDFPGVEPTPREVERWLKGRGVRRPLRLRWRRWFEACDAARYVPAGGAAADDASREAAALIHDLEGEPCVQSR
jgi:hypothetical protein